MSIISVAEQTLLSPGNLSPQEIDKVLAMILQHKVDYADLYFQGLWSESWVLEDGLIKDGNYSIDHGVGVRATHLDKSGFAYADEITLAALQQAAKAARQIAEVNNSPIKAASRTSKINANNLYLQENPLHAVSNARKIELLQEINDYARSLDRRVNQVVVSLSGQHEIILVVATDGTYAADIRPLVRMNVNVIAKDGSKYEQASCGGGGRCGYEWFFKDGLYNAKYYAKEAVRIALLGFAAKHAPAGSMPVVLGPGWPGVLLHEAVGHGLEGDFNRKASSAFTGKINQRIASSLCTVVDDGTKANRRGSLNIDDEGTDTQCTVLIENGILKNYMMDKLNARLMGVKSTGNGRRESYAHLPMPRMTNTYMLPGKDAPEDIIANVKKGLYAVNFGGGQVDITSGKFVFNASEAYLIENGKVTYPVKGATLIGNGPDVLTKVSMVGNDLSLDSGVGVCGKDGQSVPVGVGQPTMLIDDITVGGTQC